MVNLDPGGWLSVLLRKIEGLPLRRDAVFEELKRAIVEGEIQPGTRLVEREVSDLLGVSRTPVREALQRLGGLGIVERAKSGYVVTTFDRHSAQSLVQLRAVVEGLAARLAAERIDAAAVSRLEQALTQMERNDLQRDAFSEVEAAHTAFHGSIIGASHNPFLKQWARQLSDLRGLMAAVGFQQPGRFREANAEHRAILDAITSGEPEAAEAAMRQHVLNSGRSVLDAEPQIV